MENLEKKHEKRESCIFIDLLVYWHCRAILDGVQLGVAHPADAIAASQSRV